MGRKTQTYTYDTAGAAQDFASKQRNLGEAGLGGVVFGCTKETFRECVDGLIFGLPRCHFVYVQHVSPGMPLFLYNYSDKTMHGVFRAVSYGDLDINPHGWTEGGCGKTRYPAQVQVGREGRTVMLPEAQWKPVLADNFYSASHFAFELTEGQAARLISLCKRAGGQGGSQDPCALPVSPAGRPDLAGLSGAGRAAAPKPQPQTSAPPSASSEAWPSLGGAPSEQRQPSQKPQKLASSSGSTAQAVRTQPAPRKKAPAPAKDEVGWARPKPQTLPKDELGELQRLRELQKQEEAARRGGAEAMGDKENLRPPPKGTRVEIEEVEDEDSEDGGAADGNAPGNKEAPTGSRAAGSPQTPRGLAALPPESPAAAEAPEPVPGALLSGTASAGAGGDPHAEAADTALALSNLLIRDAAPPAPPASSLTPPKFQPRASAPAFMPAAAARPAQSVCRGPTEGHSGPPAPQAAAPPAQPPAAPAKPMQPAPSSAPTRGPLAAVAQSHAEQQQSANNTAMKPAVPPGFSGAAFSPSAEERGRPCAAEAHEQLGEARDLQDLLMEVAQGVRDVQAPLRLISDMQAEQKSLREEVAALRKEVSSLTSLLLKQQQGAAAFFASALHSEL